MSDENGSTRDGEATPESPDESEAPERPSPVLERDVEADPEQGQPSEGGDEPEGAPAQEAPVQDDGGPDDAEEPDPSGEAGREAPGGEDEVVDPTPQPTPIEPGEEQASAPDASEADEADAPASGVSEVLEPVVLEEDVSASMPTDAQRRCAADVDRRGDRRDMPINVGPGRGHAATSSARLPGRLGSTRWHKEVVEERIPALARWHHHAGGARGVQPRQVHSGERAAGR